MRPGGDREMMDILALVLLHDEQQVERAVAKTLEAGEPPQQHALNCLSRLKEPRRHKPQGRYLTIPGPSRRVNHTGSFCQTLITKRYLGLSGLILGGSPPSRSQ